MSYGIHQQWSTTTKASLKTADELTSTGSKKLAASPSSNQQVSLEGIRRYHDRNVKECSFNVGDLVRRRIQNTEGLHKLSSPWEGPFIMAKVTEPGSYRLQTLEGEDVNNSWNVDQLCRFYA
jgi:hypothetical protein